MAGKKKTTFAKLNREQKLREKRAEKQMRKDARKLAEPDEEPIAPEPVETYEPVGAASPDGLGHRQAQARAD